MIKIIAVKIIDVCIIRYFKLLFGGVIGYNFNFLNAMGSMCCNENQSISLSTYVQVISSAAGRQR